MPNILFFGDSLTAGYGLANAQNESFPALIRQRIDAAGLGYQVINAGLSGDTSSGGLKRLGYWLTVRVDIFVLELGINDVIRRIPPANTFQNLQTIIKQVLQKYPDAKLMLMGMQLPSFVPGIAAEQFRAIYQKLANEYNMTLLPFFLEGVAGQRHLNLRDGVHPSAEGYKIIAAKVWPLLEPMLRADSLTKKDASLSTGTE
jgi:acyl-CoA thioesterase I